MKLLLLSLFWITVQHTVYSQGKFSSVKGVVADSVTSETMEQASVSLTRRADLATIRQQLSSKNGFEFRRIPSGNYLLITSFVGFRTDTTPISIARPDTMYQVRIPLLKLPSSLLEVVVKSVIPPVIVRSDTLVYNTGTVTTRPNATIEDLLKKLPGIEVDKNGVITLHGQKIEKIYIDGKEFFLSDPKIATQNLSADIIEAVEVFDNQSERAKLTGIKDMNVNKALNFRVKKDKKKGLFGNATVSAGTMNYHMGAATATYFKGNRWFFGNFTTTHTNTLREGKGLQQSSGNQNVNYRENLTSNLQLVVNYNGSNYQNQSGQASKRETLLGDSSLLQNRKSVNNSRAGNHNINLNFTWNPDSLTSVVYAPSVSLQNGRVINEDSSSILVTKNDINYLANHGNTMNLVNSGGTNIGNSITYQKRSRKKGRTIYLAFSQSSQWQTQDGNLFSLVNFFDEAGVLFDRNVINQRFDQQTKGNNYGLNVSYTEPIRSNQIIDIGYNFSSSSNKSAKNAFNYDSLTGKFDIPDTLTTLDFSNRSTQQTFNIGYNYLGKKVQYQLGVSAVYSFLENQISNEKYTAITQHLLNWSPRASVFYKMARQTNLQIQYNGHTTAPSIEMLRPIPDLSNPYLIRVGNPDLRQQFQHTINASYNSSNSKKFTNVSLHLGSSYISNKIVQSSHITSAGIQELKYVNVTGVYSVNSRFSYGFSINKAKNGGGNVFTNLQYNRDINFVNGEQNIRRSISIGQGLNLNYQAKEKLFGGINANIRYIRSLYSIGADLNTASFMQNYSANLTYILPFNIGITSDFGCQLFGKQGNLPGRTITSWNASVYKMLFRNKNGELRFSVFDLLNNNSGFSQTVRDNYIETRESAVLQRYFTLSFRYNFRVN